MSMVDILQALNDSSVGTSVRESLWMFPLFETIHVASIVFVVGSIARLDLRLAGLIERDRSVTEISHQLLPWTWVSFVISAIFGLLLFAAKPFMYLGMAFFDVKMVLIALAGINMLVFELITFRGVRDWDTASMPPTVVRLAAGLSLAFWISVVFCGRLIGFV
jgi:uncharacterized protein DUF6644